MDEEIKENLLEISKSVQAIGRKIGSTRTSSDDLMLLSDALKDHAKALRIYVKLMRQG